MANEKLSSIEKKILLCGYFAFGTEDYGGQPVKARETFSALQNRYGDENVHYVETMGWKRNPFKLLWRFFRGAQSHNQLIMIPAHNGLQVFSRLLWLTKNLLHKKIYYAVVGGWLAEMTEKKSGLKKMLKDFNGIWVETTSMKLALEKQGFSNVTVVPNFKNLTPVTQVKTKFEEPLPLCTFSRIMEEKGTEDAINAVININTKAGRTVYSLDMYGQIYDPYAERFSKLQESFPKYISYKGIIPSSESVDTIKEYYALLFPTHFYTEGIPGTLIDAIFAGVPVITSLWGNSGDVFKEGITGWGYPFGENQELEMLLRCAVEHKDEFIALRNSTLSQTVRYNPKKIAERLDRLMD